MNKKKNKRNWLTWRKVACVGLLLLAALYIYAEPMLEQWTGIDLPSINVGNDEQANNDNQNSNNSNSNSNRSAQTNSGNPSDFELESLPNGTKRSPAGLVYTKNSRETRIEHVMRHSKDDPSRPVHGVFDSNDKTEILMLLDEAYELILNNSPRTNGKSSSNNRMEYRIDMKRRIGYVGGQTGKRKKFPAANYLKLVLSEDRVITAFPDNR